MKALKLAALGIGVYLLVSWLRLHWAPETDLALVAGLCLWWLWEACAAYRRTRAEFYPDQAKELVHWLEDTWDDPDLPAGRNPEDIEVSGPWAHWSEEPGATPLSDIMRVMRESKGLEYDPEGEEKWN